MEYNEFLDTKLNYGYIDGFAATFMPDMLFDFQKDVVRWAVKKGRAAIFADCGLGKGQPRGAMILTPSGFVSNTELKIGDKIVGSDGIAYRLTGIHERGVQPIYKMAFSDGSSFVIDSDHLHIVRTNNDRQDNKPWRVMSTKDLLKTRLRYGSTNKSRKYDIPVVAPIRMDEKKHFIHPYILGVLLGDGCILNTCSISNPDSQIIETLKRFLPEGTEISKKKSGTIDYSIVAPKRNRNAVTDELRRLALFGKKSPDKFVPDEYLFDSVENRLWLLRGLMDTDGYISESAQFYSTSERLADNVLFLIRSLGGCPTRSIKRSPKYSYRGENRTGKDCHVLTFSLKTFNPFHLARKAEKWNPNPRDNGRWIEAIAPCGEAETICLSVDSPDHSYVTENFIVTHNTLMQISWARNVNIHNGGKTIIFAPLSVCEQTIEEGRKIDVRIKWHSEGGIIQICNYENMDKLNPADYSSIVLDESGILKSVDGKTRKKLIEFARDIPYRLACTATPAPNDISEIANHTEFLGIMKREEMLSKWFYNDGQQWNLKGHAIEKFYEWMSTWGFFLTKPSDLGYEDKGFVLPSLKIEAIYFPFEWHKSDALFDIGLKGIEDRMAIRKDSVAVKAEKIARMVNASDEQWIIWTGIDIEADTMHSLIPDSINLKGPDKQEDKTEKINAFKNGSARVMVTKSKIAGWGMCFHNSHNMIFFGLSDSYEAYYQCIRRQYRFGQKFPVNVYIALAGNESTVLDNVLRKERQAKEISAETIKKIRKFEEMEVHGMKHEQIEYKECEKVTARYTMYNADSCIKLGGLPSDSVDFTVFSPPFASLYTYSNSERDLGNCQRDEEFFEHYGFISKELFRVTKPGRNIAVHCMNIPTRLIKHGYIGIMDFRGDLIRHYQAHGFIYYGEVCIWKNPQSQSIRTHTKCLAFKQFHKDSSDSRPGLPDYVLIFKKPGENKVPVTPILSGLDNDAWIEYASPIWMNVRETYTLNSIKTDKDEKHICPLQLDVIERLVLLYTNKGETVLDPFSGIGSTGYICIKKDRKHIGIELKKEYYNQAIKNLDEAAFDKKQEDCTLFDIEEMSTKGATTNENNQ